MYATLPRKSMVETEITLDQSTHAKTISIDIRLIRHLF